MPECVEAVHADIGGRTATGKRRVGDPGTRRVQSGVGELSTRMQDAAEASGMHPLPRKVHRLVEAHDVRDTQGDADGLRRLQHALTLGDIHGHWLFAQDGLAVTESDLGVFEMQGVWRREEDRVDLRVGTEGFWAGLATKTVLRGSLWR